MKSSSESGRSLENAAAVRPSYHRRLRLLLARLAIAGLSGLVALVICEIGVRLFRPQLLFPRYVTASDFGVRMNVPDARYWHTSPEMRVQFRINSMGIRSDREYSFEKPEGIIRIVGLGDSFTQGYEVEVEETYLYRLEEMLRARGLPVEVINLGVSGYGTAEELIMLREFGLRFDPDVVIVGHYQNDLADNVRSNLYGLDESGELIRVAASYLPAVRIRDKLYSFWTYRWLAGHSQLFSLVREGMAKLVKRKMLEGNTGRLGQGEAEQYAAQLEARLLDEMKKLCAQRGIGFLVLDIPSYSLEESWLPVSLLEHVASDEIVDVAPRLRAEGADAYLYRRRGHFHWTPRAHEIAAQLLADRLMLGLGGSSATAKLSESGS